MRYIDAVKMKIGNLDLGKKAVLAPMAEITDAPFRQINREYGAGFTFTQMISAKGILENSFLSLQHLAFRKDEKPIGIQLLGNIPDYVQRAVAEISSMKPDLIELNCGCSVPQVCQYGLGASILDRPAELGNLVKVMVKSSNGIPISIKMRAGKDRKNISAIRNAKIIEDNGASSICIHGRTRSDSYSDLPDWNWIKMIKESVSIPVFGNGNLFEPEECVKMIRETGCDSVYIARGSFGNPFIFKRFNSIMETGEDPGAPTIDEIAKTAIRHFKLLLKDVGELQGIKKARKFIVWYFKYHNGIYEFKDKLYSLVNPAEIEEYILEHAEKLKQKYYPEEDIEKIKKEFNERVLFWINESDETKVVH